MAVSNINDKNFVFAPITLNRDVNREQRTSNIEGRVTRIDREITARERYVDSLVESRDLLKQNIEVRQKRIAGGERLIKLHQEQKENINKRVGLLEKNNELLNGMLEKRHNRSKSVQPVQTSKLEEVNTLPKGTLISEQKAKLESDVKKHNIAIDYHDKKLAKLVDTDKAKEVVPTTKPSKKEGLASGYKPNNPIPTLKTDNKPDTVKSASSYVSNFSSQQQRYIVQSQVNIWNSIASANIRKLI